MKPCSTFFLLMFLFAPVFLSVPSDHYLPQQLEPQFLEAIQKDDEALYTLVKAYRYKTYALVIELLDKSLSSELNDEFDDSHECRDRAEKLAKTYSDIYKTDCLMERIKLYRGWFENQKMEKVRADSLKDRGIQAYERTDFENAINSWSESLSLYRELGDRRGEGSVLYKMGVVHSRLGQRREATRYSEQALQIEKAIGNIIGEAYLYTRAFFYSRIGRYETAIELYNHALEAVREIGDEWQERRALNFIAWNYYLMHEYETAIGKLEKGLDIARRMGHRRGESISLCDIGLMYRNMERYDTALECYHQAVSIDREIGHTFGTLSGLIGLGEVYATVGQYSQALDAFREGLDLAEDIGSLDFLWKAQWCIGSVLEKLHQDDEALRYYRLSIRTIESIRNQLEVDAFKTYFFIENPPVYNSIIGLLAKIGRSAEAFEYAERSKAQTLLELMSERGLDVSKTIPPDLVSAKKEMEQKIQRLNSRLAVAQCDANSIDTVRDSLRMMRIEHQDLLRQIEMTRPSHLKTSMDVGPCTLKDIQQRVLGLKDAPIVIEYCVDEECTHVWVVDRDSLHYRRIDLPEVRLKSMIGSLIEPFQNLESGTTELLSLPYDLGLSYQLYLKIFEPVEVYLQEDEMITIIPDGVLHNLPFEALVVEIETGEPDTDLFFSRYENARYLVERYPLSYAYSARVLGSITRTPEERDGLQYQVLAFGNPSFEASHSRWSFEPLPETDREVRTICSVFGRSGSKVLSGRDASEDVFKEKAGLSRYIHLATHSILDDEDPFYSRIVFALDEDPKEDGFLETYEIFGLRLKADMVVLSCCESGLGKLSSGEGFIGLTRTFLCAGASSVVASLWSVGDPTTRMMKFFYQNLQTGMGKSEALRRAKVEMIHTRDEKMSYAHPFLWAPFVLVGDWK